jgi:hypothetical protein
MGTREFKSNNDYPIHTIAGYSDDTGVISCDFISIADTAFPEETHHCHVKVNDKEAIKPTDNWPGPPFSKDITGEENGESDITIKWSRAYIISLEMFHLVEQPSTLVCWATAFSIMASFRDQKSYTFDQFLNILDDGNDGHFHQLFNSDDKIFQEDIDAIIAKLGLDPINMTLDLSPSLLFIMLKQFGPLYTIITGTPMGTSHAVIIYGVNDTGGPDSLVDYIDVGNSTGHMTRTFDEFKNFYTNTYGLSNQMWYFKGMGNIGTTSADGEGKGTVPLNGAYHNHIVSVNGGVEDTDETLVFPLEISLTIDILIGPCQASPDTVSITLKTNRFPDMSATMELTGNDTVVNPLGG